MIKTLRQDILVKRALPKEDCYISGYWKIGLIEDEHQQLKRAGAGK
jgi:NADPH-dependent ferric siderophore reductase